MKFLGSLVLCLAVGLGACGDDHDHDGHAHSDTHTEQDHGGEHTPVELTSTLTISDWLSGGPLEGVELCYVIEGEDGKVDECASTNSDGVVSFTATVHDGDTVEARADKEGYFPFLMQGQLDEPVGGVIESSWVMAASDSLDLLTGVLGAEIKADKGHATVVVWGPADSEGVRAPLVGAKVAIDGAAEFGPEYLNPAEDFGTAGPFADAEGGLTAGGLVAFFNIDPATVNVTVTAEGHTCAPGLSGLPSASGAVSGKVEAGRVSYLIAFCEPTP